jgi:hypothetical protein
MLAMMILLGLGWIELSCSGGTVRPLVRDLRMLRDLDVLRMTAEKTAAVVHRVIAKLPHFGQAIEQGAYTAITGTTAGNIRIPGSRVGSAFHDRFSFNRKNRFR